MMTPPRRGRRPRDDSGPSDYIVRIRLAPSERAMLRRLVARRKRSPSNVLRDLLRKSAASA